MKKVIVVGNFGVGNLGDEAILAGSIKLLKTAEIDCKITVLGESLIDIRNQHNVKALSKFPAGFRSFLKSFLSFGFFKNLLEVIKCDLFILGGGGLFNDDEKSAVWIWFCQTILPILLCKKVALIGHSVGPLRSKFNRSLTGFVFRKAKLITVRDIESKNLLMQIGIKNVILNTDLAVALSKDIDHQKRNDDIVISLRNWKTFDVNKLKELAKFIDKKHSENNQNFLFIPFQTKISNDLLIAARLHDFLEHKSALKISDKKYNFREVIEIISCSKAVIGMRLHSVIFSFITSTPVLAISYSKKVKDFANTNGIPYINLDDISTDNLENNLNSIIKSGLSEQKINSAFNLASEHSDLIRKLLS